MIQLEHLKKDFISINLDKNAIIIYNFVSTAPSIAYTCIHPVELEWTAEKNAKK